MTDSTSNQPLKPKLKSLKPKLAFSSVADLLSIQCEPSISVNAGTQPIE